MGLIKDYLFTYFRQIGIANDFHDFLVLLFQDDSIPVTGSIPNRFANDIFPVYIKDRFNEYEGKSDQIIAFFEGDLYTKVIKANHSDFRDFFTLLVEGIKMYADDDNRRYLYEQAKERKASIPPLMNSSFPPKLIAQYLDFHNKTRSSFNLSSKQFATILYVILYYVSCGFLSPRYGDEILGIEYYRREYERVVVNEYGHTGLNGILAIYYLAHKENPNPIAIYEVADLEFYGRGPSGKVDKNKAYEYYKKALECKIYNPVAAFSIGYMQYYYHTREMQGFKVDELDTLTTSQRKQLAFQNIMGAFQCGNQSAANTLAVMCEDEDIPYYIRSQCLSKEEYLIFASNGTNVYAKCRLGHHYFDQALKQKNKEEQIDYYKKAYAILQDAYKMSQSFYNQVVIHEFDIDEDDWWLKVVELASRMREHWAMNEIGLYLYNLGKYDIAFKYFYRDASLKNTLASYHLLTLYFDRPDFNIHDFYVEYSDKEITKEKERLISRCKESPNKKISEYAKNL